jgi:hypothetical protein
LENTVTYNFRPMVQGTDWERTLEFKTNGTADDLTGWDAKMTFRDEPHAGGAIVIDLSTTPTAQSSVITITASSGLVTPFISDVDSDGFTQDLLYYDLKMISPSSDGSKEYVPLRGTLPILRKITL